MQLFRTYHSLALAHGCVRLTFITHVVTIIWTTEYRYTQSVMFNGISIRSNFMTPDDGRHFVQLTPSFRHIRSESKAHSALRRSSTTLLLRISPKQLYIVNIVVRYPVRTEWLTSIIAPSCPGCRPNRSIFAISSSVTPSLLTGGPPNTENLNWGKHDTVGSLTVYYEEAFTALRI